MSRPLSTQEKRKRVEKLKGEMQELLTWCVETKLPVDSPEFKERKDHYNTKKAEVEQLEMELEIDNQ
jgi:hypothetical protein